MPTTWTRYLMRAGTHEFRYQTEVIGRNEVWLGFELPFDRDLSEWGMMRTTGMTAEEIASCGVNHWTPVDLPAPTDLDLTLLAAFLRNPEAFREILEEPDDNDKEKR